MKTLDINTAIAELGVMPRREQIIADIKPYGSQICLNVPECCDVIGNFSVEDHGYKSVILRIGTHLIPTGLVNGFWLVNQIIPICAIQDSVSIAITSDVAEAKKVVVEYDSWANIPDATRHQLSRKPVSSGDLLCILGRVH
jgi:hypothetical protein